MRFLGLLVIVGCAAFRDTVDVQKSSAAVKVSQNSSAADLYEVDHGAVLKAKAQHSSILERLQSGRSRVYAMATSHSPHALIGALIFAIWMCAVMGMVGLPCCCLLRGHLKSRELREKLENLKLQHPEHLNRQPPSALSDGMQRLAQEDCIIIKEHVNMLQEATGHLLNYSIQTANCFDVFSVSNRQQGEQLLSCREHQDLQAMIGMNLAGGLQAMGLEGAGAFAGRDKAPFRMMIGLPQAQQQQQTNTIQVQVPAGVAPGQQIQVTAPDGAQMLVAVPAGVAPGQVFPVLLPNKPPSSPSSPVQGLMGMAQGLVPGAAANTDAPFLYLDRPFAFDIMCVNRPQVDVYDMRGGAQVKIGVISDPFAWVDMTFGIHLGPTATKDDAPILKVKGAACQPGAVCQLCGLCCGRQCQEAYLEVVDPNDGERTVAFITKGWAGGLQEMFTSANSYYIDFGEVRDPTCKGLLLATALFVNYRFFEGSAGQQHSS